jgi:hypothetical protein
LSKASSAAYQEREEYLSSRFEAAWAFFASFLARQK